jgi:hypothetical protein
MLTGRTGKPSLSGSGIEHLGDYKKHFLSGTIPFNNPRKESTTMIKISPEHVHDPQHLRSLVTNVGGETPLVLDVYTGWLVFDFDEPSDNIRRDQVISWVPLGTKTSSGAFEVQTYPEGADAVVTASLSSFGDGASVAAVDGALIEIKKQPLPGRTVDPVLVLIADVAVSQGGLHRVSYQVTVLANTKERGQEFRGQVDSIPPGQVITNP